MGKVFAALILVLPCILCFPNTGSSGSDVWTAEDEAAARERLRSGNLGRVVISGGQAVPSSGVRGSSSASRFGGSSGSSSSGFSTRSSSQRDSLNAALSGKKNQIRISQIMDRDSSSNRGFSGSERGCKSCHLVHAHTKAKHGHGHA